MRYQKTRSEDSTFDINLAPMLDVIVAIIPMLLLSIAFVEVSMIETPLPEMVQEMVDKKNGEDRPSISLYYRADKLSLLVEDGTQKKSFDFPHVNGKADLEALANKAIELKRTYPTVFQAKLFPEKHVPFQDLIRAMDAMREAKDPLVMFNVTDKETGKSMTTRLMFPKMAFGNVGDL